MREKSKGTPHSSRKRKSPYDELPELTDEMLERAVIRKAGRTIGRPRLANPKVAISLRMDSEALRRWKAKGPGWQTRMTEVLKAVV